MNALPKLCRISDASAEHDRVAAPGAPMPGNAVYIIAEAGVNHNGDPALAFQLVDAARASGADAVKFQAFQASNVVSSGAPKAAYQLRTTEASESQLDMIRRLELRPEVFRELCAYCDRQGIVFLATPFDAASVTLLAEMGLGVFKIPSGEITNLPYLRQVGALRRELILSTGMSTLAEVDFALGALEKAGTMREKVSLLHCTTEYPAPFAEVNLRAMQTMREAFPGIKGVGYSDHTVGIEAPIAATALGATVIEKHFTLDRTMAGPDHKASLEPEELAAMVRGIRNIEAALGAGSKRPAPSEERMREVVRRSVVAARHISAGELLTENNLTTKRPGTGVSPVFWDHIIGMKAPADLAADELLPLSWLPGEPG